MTVEIITKGRERPKRTHRLRCNACGCVFTCQREDLFILTSRTSMGTGAYEFGDINCPCCDTTVTVSGAEL